ncbi:hypothetical protein [Kineosporia sp. A_224]|uniref:hypothetical protein n=1 Tax=Kineosporia sp. A_224 TaxID=1962180 RepID=UPI000B4AADC5|nr:hypothetical protein [Kineosporia sp. A_224]
MLALLLSVAGGVRLGLLLLEWPASNSDEATTGLMAMHIAEGRHAPVFMYGQSYMGTAQAFLAAVPFRTFGPSLIALRVPMLLAFLLFLTLVFVLGRRLYGTPVALMSVALLTLGSREQLGYELIAQGAVPETLVGGTLLLLLGHRLLEVSGAPGRGGTRRGLLAAWGTTASVGLWSTALVAPFVATSAVLVVMSLRRHPAKLLGSVSALVVGLVAGAAPWILHDVTHPWRDSGVVSVVNLYLHGGTGLNGQSAGLGSQVANTLTTSLAYMTGGSAVAHPQSLPAWPFGYWDSGQPPTDNIVAALWGFALVALWATGLLANVRTLRRRRRATRQQNRDSPALATVCTRLAMLGSAGLTVVAFAASPAPGIAPANNVRYIIGALVATPAVIAPLWSMDSAMPKIGRPLRVLSLTIAALALAVGTVQAYSDAGRGPSEAARRQLLDSLEARGVTHVYSGYFDCGRLTFLSAEQVTCAVVYADSTGRLRPGFDRYSPYRAQVRGDAAAGYVFQADDPRNRTLDDSGCTWSARWSVAGYEVRQPAGRCEITQP